MRARWASWALLAAGLLALSGCAKPEHALTYRLTVTLSDNGRPISGSVVRREDWVPNQIGGDNVPLMHEVKGDAIVLPVRGRLLVVTLAGWDKLSCTGPRDPQGCAKQDDWSPQAASADATVGQPGAWAWKAPASADGRASLAANQLPVLVTFDGAPALAGVRVVDPTDLERVLGLGVRFQSAVVERTNDGVTRGVAVVLPFLHDAGPQMRQCILADPPPTLPPGAQLKNPDLGDCVWNDLFTQ